MISTEQLNNVLKIYYSRAQLLKKLYEDSVTVAMIPKTSDGSGKELYQPYSIGRAQAASANFKLSYDFATTGGSSNKYVGSTLDWDDYYSHWSVDVKRSMRTKGPNAYIKLVQSEVDGVKETMGYRRINHILGNGVGQLGVVKTVADKVITLANQTQGLYFEKGAELHAASSARAARQTGGANNVYKVTAVDRKLNQITLDVNTGLVAGDLLFSKGDVLADPKVGIKPYLVGLEGWLPKTVTAGENFFGLDRTQDRFRLAGTHIEQGAGETIEDTLRTAIAEVDTLGGRFDFYAMNPLDYNKLVEEISQKDRFDKGGMVRTTDGFRVGFSSIVFYAPNGRIVKAYSDKWIPEKTVYGLNFGTWEINSMGPLIQTWNADGRVVDRIAGSNAIAGSNHSYALMICRSPRDNCRITLT